MNKASITRTPELQFPKGEVICWTGNGPFAGVPLKILHSPTVFVVTDPTEPLTFEGSADGEKWVVIRDKDSELVRITKAGAYRLPVATAYLRPVCRGAVTIQTFIGKGV